MNANTLAQWKVPSETCCERFYVVSEMADKSWQCSCTGWTRHVPRRDCKHILYVRTFGGGIPYDPLLASVIQLRRAAERKAQKEAA